VSETYFPLDVSLWIPADLLERVELPENLRLELTADIYSVLDRVEPTAFPIEQQVKYSTRRYRLGQVLSDSAMSDAAFEQLAKDGSTVGYYLQARSIGPSLGAEAPDVIVDDDKRKAEDAVTFLTKHWDATVSPSLALMLRFRAVISSCFSSSKGSNCSVMKRRSRFISRTGTAATIDCRTRIPVAFASASSRRRLSCSALKLASAFGVCFFG
jgi:hypothetical protein